MALTIISIILVLACISGFIYHFLSYKKRRDLLTFNKQYLIEFVSPLALFTLSSLLMSIGIKMWANYPIDGLHSFYLYFGTIIFSTSLFALFEAFVIYFYKPELNADIRKWVKRTMFISIPVAFIFFIMTIEGHAPYLKYPLYNGIAFTSSGVKLVTANDHVDGFRINWYGLIILSGAIIAYFVSDHHFYQEYKKHGLIDSLFILVFIMGVIGARFWYCFVLEKNPSTFFKFQDGGLAIMGGVLFGGLSGILFMIFFRRYINLRHAMDLILPCVLIAQAIGRWGNFFNQEVFGYTKIAYDSCWWLPTFIKNQMQVTAGFVNLPLFLIEFITNLAGYFIIVYAVGKGLKKHLSNGDLFFLYISWYGLTRVILEPLRASDFEYNASYITAWVMFGGGLAAIIILHVYDYFIWKKLTFNVDKMKENEVGYYHFKEDLNVPYVNKENGFINFFSSISYRVRNKLKPFYSANKNPYKKLFKANEEIKN